MAIRSYIKVTPEDVIRCYRKGYNFSQIARELGCCRNTVRKKIREHVAKTGDHIYIRTKPSIGSYTHQTIWQLWNENKTVKEIAAAGNVSRSYVYKVIKGYTDASR